MEMKGKITIYDDNGDTIIKISETKNDFTDIIQKMLENICNTEITSKKITELEKAEGINEKQNIEKIGPPAFLTEKTKYEDEEEDEEEIGNYVITMNCMYQDKGLTIDEIYERNPRWIMWMAENYTTKNLTGKKKIVAEKDIEQIKKFVKMIVNKKEEEKEKEEEIEEYEDEKEETEEESDLPF